MDLGLRVLGDMPVKKAKATSRISAKVRAHLQAQLQVAQLRAEKCELKEAKDTFYEALVEAKKVGDFKTIMEAISGLLRLSGEALDHPSIDRWDGELDRFMAAHPRQIPPMAWYCKGAVARHKGNIFLAQRCFHRFLRAVVADGTSEESIARGWVMLAIILQQRNRLGRSQWLVNELLRRYEKSNFRGVNGILYLLMGTLYERRKDLKSALRWFQKAHGQFLADHNWYYHLYALYGYARIARLQRNYSRAYWYLDLVDKAAGTPEFGLLRKEIIAERTRLEEDAVDLLIDSRKGVIKTREVGQISLRKQYVLLHILEALSNAHKKNGSDLQRGLSKAEIIEAVWKEPYSPSAHDNKLYYNINRLRKLIEPNVRKPQYLLNWKEGYRLAPGLKIQLVENQSLNDGETS